jgi:hypothetical protein
MRGWIGGVTAMAESCGAPDCVITGGYEGQQLAHEGCHADAARGQDGRRFGLHVRGHGSAH